MIEGKSLVSSNNTYFNTSFRMHLFLTGLWLLLVGVVLADDPRPNVPEVVKVLADGKEEPVTEVLSTVLYLDLISKVP